MAADNRQFIAATKFSCCTVVSLDACVHEFLWWHSWSITFFACGIQWHSHCRYRRQCPDILKIQAGLFDAPKILVSVVTCNWSSLSVNLFSTAIKGLLLTSDAPKTFGGRAMPGPAAGAHSTPPHHSRDGATRNGKERERNSNRGQRQLETERDGGRGKEEGWEGERERGTPIFYTWLWRFDMTQKCFMWIHVTFSAISRFYCSQCICAWLLLLYVMFCVSSPFSAVTLRGACIIMCNRNSIAKLWICTRLHFCCTVSLFNKSTRCPQTSTKVNLVQIKDPISFPRDMSQSVEKCPISQC